MDKEAYFISKFNDQQIGDDGAVLDGLVYSKDLFCEDIHFKRSWMRLEQIAKKSMLVNISDAIAMNATPLYALIGIVIPKHFSHKDLEALALGFNEAANAFDLRIIGGDTTSGKSLMISVTIISKSKKPLYRSGIKKGELLAYTGKIGESKKGLKTLLRGGKLGANSRFITPQLRQNFIKEAANYINHGLDISDGLSKDLSRLCAKKVGVQFTQKLSKNELCSGEEYEMLFSFDKRHKHKIASIAKKHRVKLNIFGYTCTGKYQCRCHENHF
ncbi:MAG: thiamine-phosphate kinase [Sulfurospirillum sp.]|nr:thiamine-phosphate kinase [Sulfurospirillum sp.]